ncbi:DNAJC25 (predicted) [Pycnogonum litorale]
MPAIVKYLIISILLPVVSCYIDGLYCGLDNCYEVLGIKRDATRGEITKAYRQLARKLHPDVHKTKEGKKEAEVMFMALANAYEILKDEESRKDYDYMLDNPDLFYQHYYRYYKRQVAPKVDVRIVIAVTITIISVIQYWSSWSRYHDAVAYLATVPKYRIKAVEIAKQEGLLSNKDKRTKCRKSKEEQREEEEKTIRKVLEEKIDIKGGYSKPNWMDVLWIQLILLPYTIITYIYWYGRWIWKFTICKQDYEDIEKVYLIRKSMGYSSSQWAALEDHEKDDFLDQQLWMKDNFIEWKKEKDAEAQAKLAENARYKSYRRYMKNHGPGQITFED